MNLARNQCKTCYILQNLTSKLKNFQQSKHLHKHNETNFCLIICVDHF